MYVYVCMYGSVCMYVYVCMYMCTYVCRCVNIDVYGMSSNYTDMAIDF